MKPGKTNAISTPKLPGGTSFIEWAYDTTPQTAKQFRSTTGHNSISHQQATVRKSGLKAT